MFVTPSSSRFKLGLSSRMKSFAARIVLLALLLSCTTAQDITLQQCQTEDGLRVAARSLGASGINVGKAAGVALAQIMLQPYAAMINAFPLITQFAADVEENKLYKGIETLPAALGGKNVDPAHLVSVALVDLGGEGPIKLTVPATKGVEVKLIVATLDPVVMVVGNASAPTNLWLLGPGQAAPAGTPATANQVKLGSTFGVVLVQFGFKSDSELFLAQGVQNDIKMVATRSVRASAFLSGIRGALAAQQAVGASQDSVIGYAPALLKSVTLPPSTQQALARVKNMTGTDLLGKFNFTTLSKNAWFKQGMEIAQGCMEEALGEMTYDEDHVDIISWPNVTYDSHTTRAAAFSGLNSLMWPADSGVTIAHLDVDQSGSPLIGAMTYEVEVDPRASSEDGEEVVWWSASLYSAHTNDFYRYAHGPYSYMVFDGSVGPVALIVGGTWSERSLRLNTTGNIATAHIPAGLPTPFIVVLRLYSKPAAGGARVASAASTTDVPDQGVWSPLFALVSSPLGDGVPPYLGNGYNMLKGYPIELSGLEVDDGVTMNNVFNFSGGTTYHLIKDAGVSGCRTSYEEAQYMNTMEKRTASETSMGLEGTYSGVTFGLNAQWNSESRQQTQTETQNLKLFTRCLFADAALEGTVDAWSLSSYFKNSALRMAEAYRNRDSDFNRIVADFIRAYGTHFIHRARYGAQYTFQTYQTARASAQYEASGFSWGTTASLQLKSAGGNFDSKKKEETENKMSELKIKWTKTNVPGNLMPTLDTNSNVDVVSWYADIKRTAESVGIPPVTYQFTPHTTLFSPSLTNLWGDQAMLFSTAFRSAWEAAIKSCLNNLDGTCAGVSDACPAGAYSTDSGCKSCYVAAGSRPACDIWHSVGCTSTTCQCEKDWRGDACAGKWYGRCVSNYVLFSTCQDHIDNNECSSVAPKPKAEYFAFKGCWCTCCDEGGNNCGWNEHAGGWCPDS